MGEDEFKNFDPQKHWAEVNNEPISGYPVNKADKLKLEELIQFCKTERKVLEMIESLKLTRGQCTHFLTVLRYTRGIVLKRTKDKRGVCYLIEDWRKK